MGTLNGTVAVIDGRTCNATDHSGCAQTPATVMVGPGIVPDVWVDPRTDTIYSADNGHHAVSVIDGRTCNGTQHSGCGQTPPTVRVPAGPYALAIDRRTRTLYVATFGDPQNFAGFVPGAGTTVSMIDTTTCNAARHSGCSETPRKFTTGDGPVAVAVDGTARVVYVVNLGDLTVTRVNANACNATRTVGCRRTRSIIPVGGLPITVTVNPVTHTVYVANASDNDVSFFSTQPR